MSESFAEGYAMGNSNNGNGYCWGGDWIWIILLFAIWNGNGFGFGGGGFGAGSQMNYTLASDFATIQRQLSDGFGGVEKGLDTIRNGVCDGFYTQAQLVNGVNANIAQLGYNMQSCCCETQRAIDGVNYNIANGFAQVNYNSAANTAALQNTICTSTRDIIDNQNANYRAIHDELVAQRIEAKDAKIAELTANVNALNLAASQAAQNNYLIGQLRPAPIPAYAVANPYAYNGCGCGCGCQGQI